MDKPIVVSGSSTPTSAWTLVRYVLVFLGGLAVAKGVLPVDTDINALIGTVAAAASALFGVYQSWKNNEQKKMMAKAVPDSVAKVT